MIVRAGTGWQMLMADLSIILFMITAAALSEANSKVGQETPVHESERSEPIAIYRSGPGSPPVQDWLKLQQLDSRQFLTVVAHYRPGEQAAAMEAAAQLARGAGDMGVNARIVVEPGEGGLTATLAFDQPQSHQAGEKPPQEIPTQGNLAHGLHKEEVTSLPSQDANP